MAAPAVAPITLALGAESFLSQRAIEAVLRAGLKADPEADVTSAQAGELSGAGWDAMVSPSLFASRRIVAVAGLEAASPQLAARIVLFLDLTRDGGGDADTVVVLSHAGPTRGDKALLETVLSARPAVVTCERLTRGEDLLAFVRAEVRTGGHIDEQAAQRLVEAVGSDLRSLAAACQQLVMDGDGHVSASLVAQYFEGRAEVEGWTIADRCVEGRPAEAVEELRWALAGGTDAVLVVGAMATSLRTLARYSSMPRGVREAEVARSLGVPPWKVRHIRSQARGWTRAGLVAALQAVARADVAVKGGGNDHVLTLTRALMEVDAARAGDR